MSTFVDMIAVAFGISFLMAVALLGFLAGLVFVSFVVGALADLGEELGIWRAFESFFNEMQSTVGRLVTRASGSGER